MTKLIESLKKGNPAGFKLEVDAILQAKMLDKIAEMRVEVMESYGSEAIRDFFEMIGAEEYEETETTISAVFPNKAALNYALDQMPDDLEFDIFYWQDLEEPVDPDIPYFPHDEDDEEHEIVPIDIEDIQDTDADDAFEIVVYKLGMQDQPEEAYENYYIPGEAITEAFSKGQMDKLQKEYSKLKRVDPMSPKFKELQAFVKSLPADAKKQIFDARIPFLWTLARESYELTEAKVFNQKQATKEFEFIYGTEDNFQTIWTSDGGKNYWMNSVSGEVLPAKEKTKPAGAKVYSGDWKNPIKEALMRAPAWPDDEMAANANTAVRHNEYASDAIDFLYGQADAKGRAWIGKNNKALIKYFKDYGLEEAVCWNTSINESYIGDETDKLIDKLFVGQWGDALSAAYNNANKKAVENVLKKYKVEKVNINKIMKKMFGARSAMSGQSVTEGWAAIKEARNDSFARKFNKMLSWSKSISGGPKEMMARIRSYSDDELQMLMKTVHSSEGQDGSARATQLKLIQRELKRRGVKESVEDDILVIDEGWVNIANVQNDMLKGKYGGDLKAAINAKNKKAIADIGARYKKEGLLYSGSDEYLKDAIKGLQMYRGIPESITEANKNEGGRLIKRRVSYAKKKRGGKLVNRRQRRRKGKVSKGAGKGYKAKGAGWKTKLIQSNRKRKISKRKNVKAQKMGKRFAARSRNIRNKLGFKKGT